MKWKRKIPHAVQKSSIHPSELDQSGCFALVFEYTAEGYHYTNISKHVSTRHCDFQPAIRLHPRLAAEPSHAASFLCYAEQTERVFRYDIIQLKNTKTNAGSHTHHPTCSVIMASVSHVFPLLGKLPPSQTSHLPTHCGQQLLSDDSI